MCVPSVELSSTVLEGFGESHESEVHIPLLLNYLLQF